MSWKVLSLTSDFGQIWASLGKENDFVNHALQNLIDFVKHGLQSLLQLWTKSETTLGKMDLMGLAQNLIRLYKPCFTKSHTTLEKI